MNIIKRIIGVLCMIIAPVAVYLLAKNGFAKMSAALPADKTNAITQWSILIIIFTPVMFGLLLFGWYALKGEYGKKEYKKLPFAAFAAHQIDNPSEINQGKRIDENL